jgi:hypothetical protein
MQVGSPLFGAPFSQKGGSIQIIFSSHINPCEGSPLFRFHDLKMCVFVFVIIFPKPKVFSFLVFTTLFFFVFFVFTLMFLVFMFSTLSLLHSSVSLLAVIPHGYLSFLSFLGFRFLKTAPPSSRSAV